MYYAYDCNVGGGYIFMGCFQNKKVCAKMRLQCNATHYRAFNFKKELAALTSIAHDNVLHVYGICADDRSQIFVVRICPCAK